MRYNSPIYDFLINDTAPRKYLPILSDPTEEDSDGDGILDQRMALYDSQMVFQSSQYKSLKDPEPLFETFLPDFGTDEYKEKIETENNVSAPNVPLFPFETVGFYYHQMYKGSLTESAENKISAMMNDVNKCKYTNLITSDNWIKFCEYFNECVQEYGEITQDIHYFRLKLNRAPETLDDMIKIINSTTEINDKWIMCSPFKGRYHMFGEDGAYNIKFISSNNTDNKYEAVYDINGKLISESDDYGKNMGTYNYASSSKNSKLHLYTPARESHLHGL